ncbi:MAG: SH3 domain-containing protein [Clostridium sp.]|nr:SH3 domain-containing protein [Clostridium sp.]
MKKAIIALLIAASCAMVATPVKAEVQVNQSSNIKVNSKRGYLTNVYFWCKGNGVRVRSQPNTSSRIIGLLYYGDHMTIETEDERWYGDFLRIRYNGAIGYVHKDYVGLCE